MTLAVDRKGHWMQTYTGKQFWPLDPRPEDIHILDIAHSLSAICRYGGHTQKFYSVAEHCVLMSYVVPEEDRLWALLHDATEAYVGDMVRPLKVDMPAFCEAEDRVMDAIVARYGLSNSVMPASVHDADTRIIMDEKLAVMAPGEGQWDFDGILPLNVKIRAWTQEVAQSMYLGRFCELYE